MVWGMLTAKGGSLVVHPSGAGFCKQHNMPHTHDGFGRFCVAVSLWHIIDQWSKFHVCFES